MSWNLVEEMGGPDRLRAFLTEFYDRIFDDILIGFLFRDSDKEALVDSQFDYVTAHLGDRSGTYQGPPIRAAHAEVPVLSGHFDRRHFLLSQLLDEWAAPDHVRRDWLTLDASLRDLVLNMGADKRDRAIGD